MVIFLVKMRKKRKESELNVRGQKPWYFKNVHVQLGCSLPFPLSVIAYQTVYIFSNIPIFIHTSTIDQGTNNCLLCISNGFKKYFKLPYGILYFRCIFWTEVDNIVSPTKKPYYGVDNCVQSCITKNSAAHLSFMKALQQLTSWSSCEVTLKCIHPLAWPCARSLGVVSWGFTRRLITQIQGGFIVPFLGFVSNTSKEPYSAVRKQMSRHPIFVNTSCLESFKPERIGINRPDSWRFCINSWMFPKAFWHDSQGRRTTKNIRKPLVKTVSKLNFSILMSTFGISQQQN